MGLFSKKAPAPEPTVQQEPKRTGSGRFKDAPTPTRKEAEAARRARVNPSLSKSERRRRQAEMDRRARLDETARRESDPGRTLLRDHIDSRFRLGEIVLPLMILSMASLLLASSFPNLASLSIMVFYAIFAAVVVEQIVVWRGFTRLLEERHPGYPRRGLFMYGMGRILQMRRWRTPKPRVNRGDDI